MWKHLKIMKTDEYLYVWTAAVFDVIGTIYCLSNLYKLSVPLCAPPLLEKKNSPSAGQITAFATNLYRLFTELY
jgi:hypothetical protein